VPPRRALALSRFSAAANRGLHAAAFSHAAVSNALHIRGMFIPKFGLPPGFVTTFVGGFAAFVWAVSLARSHGPFSWERATEKNRNT
jgi:hypothetical protein